MAPQNPAAALSSLLRAATIDDHDEVLRTANAALKADKNDATAQTTRVVALLKLDRFDDALRALAEGGVKLEATCAIEKAYALYKTGNLDDAAAFLKSAGLDKTGFSHIAAQVAYRSERFDEAHAIYKRLLDSSPGSEENDLNINSKAAFAQSQWQSYSRSSPVAPSNVSKGQSSSDAFELCYNEACAYIASQDLDTAANLLQRAVRLCDASDELTQEDKHAEMRPILAQQAYVYAKMGKLKEALDLYQSLGSTSDGDLDFTVVAENNLSTMESSPENPFLLQRKAASWVPTTHEAKLFNYQSSLLARNVSVIDLQAHKLSGVKDRTDRKLSKSKHPTIDAETSTLAVLNAAAEVHGATGKEILRKLSGLSAKRPHDVGLVLTIIQVQIQQGQPGAALSVLESLLARLDNSKELEDQAVRFSPGLVALTVSLMRDQGRQTSAKTELVKAARYWQDRPAVTASSVLREAGVELLRSSNPQDLLLAGSAFEKLFEENQGSHIASAGLVASLAPTNPSKVQEYVKDLPPVETLIRGVNVKDLLSAGVAAVSKSGVTSLKRAAPEKVSDKPAKKRRKGKLPKNYEEGKTPDPERWLPLRDRSSYRPKGKKGKKKVADSTQGGVVKDEETLELVGGGGVRVEKASGGPPANKKKKKGKK